MITFDTLVDADMFSLTWTLPMNPAQDRIYLSRQFPSTAPASALFVSPAADDPSAPTLFSDEEAAVSNQSKAGATISDSSIVRKPKWVEICAAYSSIGMVTVGFFGFALEPKGIIAWLLPIGAAFWICSAAFFSVRRSR